MNGPTNLTLIRDGAPLLTDIPGMLREAADTLEAAGAKGLVMPDLALLVLSTPSERVPEVRCYGRHPNAAEVDGLLLHAILYPSFGSSSR
jgi:hypothetical protein